MQKEVMGSDRDQDGQQLCTFCSLSKADRQPLATVDELG